MHIQAYIVAIVDIYIPPIAGKYRSIQHGFIWCSKKYVTTYYKYYLFLQNEIPV